MPDAAYELAALRAGRVRAISPSAAEMTRETAAASGRRLVHIGQTTSDRRVVLGWQEGGEPNPEGELFSVRRLSQVPLVTLAICIGLCWRERDKPPYPGEPTTLDEVEWLGAQLGADRAHLIGALRHDLSLAELVLVDGRQVTLGPGVAAWTTVQVDALRRFADVLPTMEGE